MINKKLALMAIPALAAIMLGATVAPLAFGNTIGGLVDIKPGSDPNSINLRSMGVVPVAILGSAGFDVTTIDLSTLAFGPAGAAPAHDLSNPGSHLEDVNGDGFLDLVSHYVQKETGIACGDTEAIISGETIDGIPIDGADSVNPIPCN